MISLCSGRSLPLDLVLSPAQGYVAAGVDADCGHDSAATCMALKHVTPLLISLADAQGRIRHQAQHPHFDPSA